MASRLLVFSSEDCVACELTKPIVKAAARKRGVAVVECDPTNDPGLAQRYNVSMLPTMVLLNDGEFCGELHGNVDKNTVEKLLSFAC